MSRRRTTRLAPRPRPSGIILLEIVLALGLFVAAAAVIGSSMHASLAAMQQAKQADLGSNLTQSVLTRLTTGQIPLADASPTAFTDAQQKPEVGLDGWTYEIAVAEITDVANLKAVTITVHSPEDALSSQLTQWILDPAAADASGTGPSGGGP